MTLMSKTAVPKSVVFLKVSSQVTETNVCLSASAHICEDSLFVYLEFVYKLGPSTCKSAS